MGDVLLFLPKRAANNTTISTSWSEITSFAFTFQHFPLPWSMVSISSKIKIVNTIFLSLILCLASLPPRFLQNSLFYVRASLIAAVWVTTGFFNQYTIQQWHIHSLSYDLKYTACLLIVNMTVKIMLMTLTARCMVKPSYEVDWKLSLTKYVIIRAKPGTEKISSTVTIRYIPQSEIRDMKDTSMFVSLHCYSTVWQVYFQIV